MYGATSPMMTEVCDSTSHVMTRCMYYQLEEPVLGNGMELLKI